MKWEIEYGSEAIKDLGKLDRAVQKEILDYMDQRIAASEDPHKFGKPLRASKFGLWRYRMRDDRIICQIKNRRLVVLVVSIGHGSTIYED